MNWPDIVLFILFGFLALVGCWAVLQLARQNGRLLLRIEGLEKRPADAEQPAETNKKELGFPPGSVLNDFALPLLSGGTLTLAQWKGLDVVLIYVSPACPHSIQLLPQLAAALKTRAADSPTPLLISTGSAQENRRIVEENAIDCPVALQEDTEVAFLHRAMVTPMAYLADGEGRTIGTAAFSIPAILDLVRNGRQSSNGFSEAGVPNHVPGSRIARNGLSAGTPAPEFTLPALDGTTISLNDYRGRPLLLVFSDPDCGPCQVMAPILERAHRDSSDLNILMISRGSAEANREKVREHKVTFPVVLQRSWEISRAYAMFATPIGYLVDENGVLASGVAVGGAAILALAKQAQPPELQAGGVRPAR